MPTVEVLTKTVSNAPTSDVWSVLIATGGWHRWNGMMMGLRGDLRVGQTVQLVLKAGPREVSIDVVLEALDEDREIRWTGGIPGLITGTHYFRLESLDDGRTLIHHGERFEGLLAGLLKPVAPKLTRDYQGITDRLARAA